MKMNLLSLMDFIVLSLAAYRLTHLLVFDKIFEPIRNFFVKRDFSGPIPSYTLQGGLIRSYMGKLLICPWCAGIWVSGFLTLACWKFYETAIWICYWLAAAAVLSLIETFWMKKVGYPELVEKRPILPNELGG